MAASRLDAPGTPCLRWRRRADRLGHGVDAQLPPDPRQHLHLRLPGRPVVHLGEAARLCWSSPTSIAPGIEPPDGAPDFNMLVYALMLAFSLAGVGYLAAILLLDTGVAAVPGALTVLVVFELVFQITLFLTPGLYTTDIFSYVMYGQISAIYNLNPYIFPPNYFPNHELMNGNWIHPIWFDAPSVYGPLWTNLGWIFARVDRAAPSRLPGVRVQAASKRRPPGQPGVGVVAARPPDEGPSARQVDGVHRVRVEPGHALRRPWQRPQRHPHGHAAAARGGPARAQRERSTRQSRVARRHLFHRHEHAHQVHDRPGRPVLSGALATPTAHLARPHRLDWRNRRARDRRHAHPVLAVARFSPRARADPDRRQRQVVAVQQLRAGHHRPADRQQAAARAHARHLDREPRVPVRRPVRYVDLDRHPSVDEKRHPRHLRRIPVMGVLGVVATGWQSLGAAGRSGPEELSPLIRGADRAGTTVGARLVLDVAACAGRVAWLA